MKKILSFCLMALAVVAVVACGKEKDNDDKTPEFVNSTELVHKAFIVEPNKVAKDEVEDIISYAISFLDANHVQVEQVLAELVNGERDICSVISSVSDYRFDGTSGSFSATIAGVSHQCQFSYGDNQILSLTIDGYNMNVTPSDFVADQSAVNVLANTEWNIDQEAVAAAQERFGDMVSGIDFSLRFDGEGMTGNVYLDHPRMSILPNMSHDIPMRYTIEQSTSLNLPYGEVVMDTTSQLGSALVSVNASPVAHFVVINAHTLVLHLNVGNAAAMIQVPTSDVYLPLKRRTE